jgi:hypothetical protein
LPDVRHEAAKFNGEKDVMKRVTNLFVKMLLCATLCVIASTGRANVIKHVQLNTAPLVGNAQGPFAVDVQLTDGSGSGDANNSVTLSAFTFAGGQASGTPQLLGGALGNLGSSVVLTDSAFFNDFTQVFQPGAILGFDLFFTTNADAGAIPDGITFALLDASGNSLPTESLAGAFLTVDINTSNPAVQTFAATGDFASIGAAEITAIGTSVDAPDTLLLLLAGVGLLTVTVSGRNRALRTVSCPVTGSPKISHW